MKVLAFPILFLELLGTLVSAIFTLGTLIFGIVGSLFALAITLGLFGVMIVVVMALIILFI